MEWKVYLLRHTPTDHTWTPLGTVEADAEEDVFPFAAREWGLGGTDQIKVVPLFSEDHAAYMYQAIKEFLGETEHDDGSYSYPETTAVAWMKHAVALIEEHDNMEEREVRRV